MRKLVFIVFALCLCLAPARAQKRTRITILSTTDLHGNILPVDYYTNKPDNRGLLQVAAFVGERPYS